MFDAQGRVIAVVAGWPHWWGARIAGATAAMERLASKISPTSASDNRRGDFKFCAAGFSYGNGQPVSPAAATFHAGAAPTQSLPRNL